MDLIIHLLLLITEIAPEPVSSRILHLGTRKKQLISPTYENVAFMIVINDTDKSIEYHNYNKNWKHETFSKNTYYQGDITVTDVVGEYFEYRFIGTGINCFVGSDRSSFSYERGEVEINLDGNFEGLKEIPITPTQSQLSVFQKFGLEKKEHTLKVILKRGALALDSIGIYP